MAQALNKLLICDKDGTLVSTASGHQFVQHPEDQVIIPGADKAIQKYFQSGWHVAISSNQGGVEAGFKTLDSANEEMSYAVDLFETALNVNNLFLSACFCPDFQGKKCCDILAIGDMSKVNQFDISKHLVGTFRKPSTGMVEYIKLLIPEGFEEILFVGDRDEDQQCAIAAGIDFKWAHEWRLEI